MICGSAATPSSLATTTSHGTTFCDALSSLGTTYAKYDDDLDVPPLDEEVSKSSRSAAATASAVETPCPNRAASTKLPARSPVCSPSSATTPTRDAGGDRHTEQEVAWQAAVRQTWTTQDREKMDDYKVRLKREGRANETEGEREDRLEKRRVYDRTRPKPKMNNKAGRRTRKSRSAPSELSDGEQSVDEEQFGDGVGEDDGVESGEEGQLYSGDEDSLDAGEGDGDDAE